MTKGSAWWAYEMNERRTIEEEKRAYKQILQKKVTQVIRKSRGTNHKASIKKVNKLADESKMNVDEEFSGKPNEKFREN